MQAQQSQPREHSLAESRSGELASRVSAAPQTMGVISGVLPSTLAPSNQQVVLPDWAKRESKIDRLIAAGVVASPASHDEGDRARGMESRSAEAARMQPWTELPTDILQGVAAERSREPEASTSRAFAPLANASEEVAMRASPWRQNVEESRIGPQSLTNVVSQPSSPRNNVVSQPVASPGIPSQVVGQRRYTGGAAPRDPADSGWSDRSAPVSVARGAADSPASPPATVQPRQPQYVFQPGLRNQR